MAENLLASFKFFSEVPPDTLEAIGKKGELLEFGPGDIIRHFLIWVIPQNQKSYRS